MDRLPEAPDARRAWLEQWAVQQHKQLRRRQEARNRRRPPALIRELRKTIGMHTVRLDETVDRVFDRRLHTLHTSQPVDNAPQTANGDGVAYMPSSWHVLPRALRAVEACNRDVFVDFGCGKGRIVHQAARRPLRGVIGVEVSPELADFARSLVAAHRLEHRCRNVEIVACDAARFPVPDDLTIAYFFHPFGADTLDTVLGNLIDSIDRHPRHVRLIYVCPTHGERVLATDRFQLAAWQRGGLRDVRFKRAAIFESVT